MAHDHDHDHGGHHHHDHETPQERVKRYAVSTAIGYFFGLSQAAILYFLLRSFGGESDTGHTLVDSTNYLANTFLAFLMLRLLISKYRAEVLGRTLNALFFLFGAAFIFYEIATMEPHRTLPWQYLLLLGGVGALGNLIQAKVFGHHEAEGHTTDTSTEGHIFYDLLNSVFVMLVAIFIWIDTWYLFPLVKGYLVFLILFGAGILILQLPYIKWDRWNGWQWAIYQAGLLTLSLGMAYLVGKGEIGYLDKLTAALVACGMAITGILIIFFPAKVHHH